MQYARDSLVHVVSAAALGVLLIGSAAFADTRVQPQGWMQGQHMGRGEHHAPGVFGIVAQVSGTGFTLESRGFGPNAATTAYRVDASQATVFKDGATSTVAAIAAGDRAMVQGAVSGTNIAATVIRDGVPQGMGRHGGWGPHASSTPGKTADFPQGNGQPVVGGTVSAVSGNAVTITNKAGSYVVDASKATITKAGQTIALTQVQVGDALLAQGTISGANVAATSLIDQGQAPAQGGGDTVNGGRGHLFAGIGGFFRHLFGFF